MGIHATGCAIAPFNGGSVGFGIAQALKRLPASALRAMHVADVHLHNTLALSMLD
jgi:hypothetical protein